MLWTDSTLRVIEDHAEYIAPDGAKYPPNWDKSNIPGLFAVTTTNPPTDANVVVTGYYITEDYTQAWITRLRTSEDDRNDALAEIDRLEALETKRRIAEAMPDDAGGTPEGRAWLAANRVAIAALRAGL